MEEWSDSMSVLATDLDQAAGLEEELMSTKSAVLRLQQEALVKDEQTAAEISRLHSDLLLKLTAAVNLVEEERVRSVAQLEAETEELRSAHHLAVAAAKAAAEAAADLLAQREAALGNVMAAHTALTAKVKHDTTRQQQQAAEASQLRADLEKIALQTEQVVMDRGAKQARISVVENQLAATQRAAAVAHKEATSMLALKEAEIAQLVLAR